MASACTPYLGAYYKTFALFWIFRGCTHDVGAEHNTESLLACASRAAQGSNDDVYAASEIMSSIVSFSITGFMSALAAPPRTPARKS